MFKTIVKLDNTTRINTNILGIILGLGIALISYTANQKTDSAIITGKVNVNWSNSLKLSNGAVNFTDPWIDRLNIGDSIINLEDDGTFKIKLPIKNSDFYTLSYESNEVELFISPNDSVYIDFNAETVVSGKGEKLNSHLKSLRGIINSNRKYINGIDFYNQPTIATNAILDSLELVYLNAHEKFKLNNPVNKIFEQKIVSDITYRKKLYQIVHPALFKQKTNENLPVKKTYYQDIVKGSFNNPNLLKSLDYILFLDAYLTAQSAGEYKYGNYFDESIEKIHPRYTQIQQLDAHEEIKDYLFNAHLNQSMDNYGVSYLEDLMQEFRKDCKNTVFLEKIEDRFQKGIEKREEPSEIKIYKTIGNIELEAHIFYPEDFREGDQRPAYLFFHGGGWSIGTPDWGYKNCKNYSSKGMVAISFEYQLIDIHNSNLLDCVRDAKSAILWVRKQAKILGVDPNKIVAAGFSAGGHLAACTAILNEYEEVDNSGLSSKPDAIIVHSASYNTLKNNWFSINSEQKAESISTFHQLGGNLVPSIFFHGTDDHLAPISEFTEFKDKMYALGNDFEYKIFENVGHFFNNSEARKTVLKMTETFLVKLGYIESNKNKNQNFIRSFNGSLISKSKMDAFIKHQMDSLNMPGLSITFINDDKIAYHNAIGVKNIETQEKVDDSTIFDAASMSKTVFSFFTMKMVDDGLLDLDTPLYTYMEYPDIAYDERYKSITSRMVLSHTSGFPNWRYLDQQGNYDPKGKLTIQFEPGTKFQYSGEGYEYLAKVIAHLKGIEKNELQGLIRTAVFEPLAMKNSSFIWNDYIEKHRVDGHFRGELNKGYSSNKNDPNFKASASLQTESKEFSHLLMALMNNKILSEKSCNEMMKIQSIKLAAKNSREQKYGLGIAIEESDYGINYSHGGDNLSNTALYRFNLERKVGFVFFTNSENRNKFAKNLLDFLLM